MLEKITRGYNMNHFEKKQDTKVYLGLSAFLHTVVMSFVFFSFIQLSDPKKTTPQILPAAPQKAVQAPALSAPVILYSGPVNTPQPPTLPATAQGSTTQKPSKKQVPKITKKSPQEFTKDAPSTSGAKTESQEKQSQKTLAHKPGALARAIAKDLKAQLATQKQSPTMLSKDDLEFLKPLSDTPHEPEESPKDQQISNLFDASPKAFDDKDTAQESDLRKRQLTLADLFKDMPHTLKQITSEGKEGEELVIVQGDMKYYSFLKQFLNHINEVFAFHGGPQKLFALVQSGRVKQSAGLSVIIDKQGKVINKKLMKTTGCSQADGLLLDAIESASPFPPVPHHFGHEQVRVELISVT